MPVTVTEDIDTGSLSATLTRRGWEVDRIFYVSGLEGTVSQFPYLAATATGIPAIDSTHPTITSIKVDSIRPQMRAPDSAIVTVHYSKPGSASGAGQPPVGDPAQIEVGANLQQVSVDRDINDAVVLLTHTIASGDVGADGAARVGQPVSEPAQTTALRPHVTFTYTRTENASPGSTAKTYVGKINSLAYEGGAIGTWLCTSITGRSKDGGDTYVVSYSFEYDPEGWNKDVALVDRQTGKPFPTLVDGVGIKTFLRYESIDFTGLSLV